MTGTYAISFLKAGNSALFQDIVFSLQADGSYAADLVPEVSLSAVVPTFSYTGKVTLNGTVLASGSTKVSFPDTCTVKFGDSAVVFRVHRAYAIPTIEITTDGGASITSKTDYVTCSIKLDGKNMYADYSASGAKIRLRGNSTLTYYNKKPYRIKLGAKAALLGLAANKDWVLLANYRDPTNFMNAVTFDMARYMGMPYTNSNRFVEVTLNGTYIGMYQFTEQIEQGESRVNIDKTSGVLLNLDLDDGPDLASSATDNFTSTVYSLPVCVKYPDDVTAARLDSVKTDFTELETLIKNGDYTALSKRLDITSLINFLIIQELTRNVELVSPRSMYMYKSSDNIYHFGPVWDFDGGFAFDWVSMTDGHNYFGSDTWLMGSTNPAQHPVDAYNEISGFFVNMFSSQEFVSAYKARWNEISLNMLTDVFAKLDDYVLHTSSAMERNAAKWPIDKTYSTEIQNMKTWLTNRVSSYTNVVAGY